MGILFSTKKRIIPIQTYIKDKYTLKKDDVKVINEEILISYPAFEKVYKNNLQLIEAIKKLEESDFEYIICYNKNISCKQKISCNHDICVNCYHLIRGKNCPLCKKKIKK